MYHLPHYPAVRGDVAFFSCLHNIPLIRQILKRENVDICHGHLGSSILMQCFLLVAKTCGYHTILTEHSLFQYDDLAGIHLNKMQKWSSSQVDGAIAVSHVVKENMVLRMKISPQDVYVIPNGIDFEMYYNEK